MIIQSSQSLLKSPDTYRMNLKGPLMLSHACFIFSNFDKMAASQSMVSDAKGTEEINQWANPDNSS